LFSEFEQNPNVATVISITTDERPVAFELVADVEGFVLSLIVAITSIGARTHRLERSSSSLIPDSGTEADIVEGQNLTHALRTNKPARSLPQLMQRDPTHA
jgi:hypothetical protein